MPSIGETAENNDIFAVYITNLSNGNKKKKVWLESLIHAREWITGSTTQYIFNELSENLESNSKTKKILDETEIVFILIVNPDGYKFTQMQRFWRKNRNGSGIDINRNFPSHWGGQRVSDNSLEDDYRDPSAGSELETKETTSCFDIQGHIAGTINFHSYCEPILLPAALYFTDFVIRNSIN